MLSSLNKVNFLGLTSMHLWVSCQHIYIAVSLAVDVTHITIINEVNNGGYNYPPLSPTLRCIIVLVYATPAS